MVLDAATGRWYAEKLLQTAASQCFYSYSLLRKEVWEPVVLRWESETHVDIWSRYQLDSAGALLVVALRYAPDVAPESSESRAMRGLPPLPSAAQRTPCACSIGRFARANWYQEVLARLKNSVSVLSEEAKNLGKPVFPARQWHRFVNSKFPEKALAITAGIGALGRNGLVIARKTEAALHMGSPENEQQANQEDWSSAVVLGLMFLPFGFPAEINMPHHKVLKPLSRCGACTRCVQACPSKALSLSDVPAYDRERCIQNYTSSCTPIPAAVHEAWGSQLYGCDICLEACPWFKPDQTATSTHGCIGGFFDAAAISTLSDEQIRLLFKGSALDQKWIEPEALRRNACRVSKMPMSN